MSENKLSILTRLKHSLQLLAIPANQQLDLLPDFVAKADELALEFGNWHLISTKNYGAEFTVNQIEALQVIDSVLEKMSGAENAAYWTEDAVREDQQWARIRLLAQKALNEFEWKIEEPLSYRHEYIPGGKA